ncbi:MAG: hypothetical protein GX591_18120 [Planctomycetes bacterium]|nr:hypothetical protein [Planctomycetota bacterium]
MTDAENQPSPPQIPPKRRIATRLLRGLLTVVVVVVVFVAGYIAGRSHGVRLCRIQPPSFESLTVYRIDAASGAAMTPAALSAIPHARLGPPTVQPMFDDVVYRTGKLLLVVGPELYAVAESSGGATCEVGLMVNSRFRILGHEGYYEVQGASQAA